MPEPTLESLAARVAELERRVDTLAAVVPPVRDWRSVVGISEETEYTRQVEADILAAREAEREAARNGVVE